MANLGQSGFLAAPTTVMSTGLNALANGANAVSGALDNTSDKALWAMLELTVTFASAPVQGAAIEVFLLPSIDDTNYADGDASVAPSVGALVGLFNARGVATAQRLILNRILLTPSFYKWHIINRTAVAFTASGHLMKERRWELEST